MRVVLRGGTQREKGKSRVWLERRTFFSLVTNLRAIEQQKKLAARSLSLSTMADAAAATTTTGLPLDAAAGLRAAAFIAGVAVAAELAQAFWVYGAPGFRAIRVSCVVGRLCS